MTPDQIRSVRSSFALLLPQAEHAARVLRAELPAPLAQRLQVQDGRLLQALGALAGLLDNPQVLRSVLPQLGRGIDGADHDAVCAALMRMLERCLGVAFDRAARDAWSRAFALASELLLEAEAAA